jgi:putative membrane protein
MSDTSLRRILCIIYAVLWTALAIHPLDRHDWVLENVLVVVLIGMVVAGHRRFALSRGAFTLLFVFMCLHCVGAHYTYAQVPYDAWTQRFAGFSLNHALGWERNNFDRVVHFSYGLLLVCPVREVFTRATGLTHGFWSYFLPMDLMMSTSMLYELIEWAVAGLFGGDLGMAYLGTQGDVWDAHKDMALASLGALISILLLAAVHAARRRSQPARV